MTLSCEAAVAAELHCGEGSGAVSIPRPAAKVNHKVSSIKHLTCVILVPFSSRGQSLERDADGGCRD